MRRGAAVGVGLLAAALAGCTLGGPPIGRELVDSQDGGARSAAHAPLGARTAKVRGVDRKPVEARSVGPDAPDTRGHSITLTEDSDPFRQTKTYQHAAAYCAERGETAVLRETHPRLGGRRAYVYDCVHTVTRRGG